MLLFNNCGTSECRVEKIYFANRKVLKEKCWDENKLIWVKMYYDSGNTIQSEVIFINDTLAEGQQFTENGILHSKGNYVYHNARNYDICYKTGIHFYYDFNGKLKSEVTYKRGIKEGKCVYYKNDEKESEGYFRKDNEDGIWLYYTATGEVKKYYRNGLEIDSIIN